MHIYVFVASLLISVSSYHKRDSVVFDTELIGHKLKHDWHPNLIALANNQARLDASSVRFAPNLDYEILTDSKMHYEYTPMGRLTLNQRIGQSGHSAVFSVRENPGLIIKYQSNCNRAFLPHPLLLDYWGLNHAARHNVPQIPRVHFVSPAVRFPRKRTTKCDFLLSDPAWQTCANSTVRYIVMEKLELSVFTLHAVKPVTPITAINFGIQLMEILKQLHSTGIVHGDIHSGNVLLDKRGRVNLIDFDQFQFDSGMIKKTRKFKRTHPFLSPWELEGYSSSYRDDIFRAISVISELLNPVDLYRDFLFSRLPEELLFWKMNGLLFSAMPQKFVGDNWGVSDPLVVARLTQLVTEILVIVRSPTVKYPDTYDSIINLLKRVDWILTRSV